MLRRNALRLLEVVDGEELWVLGDELWVEEGLTVDGGRLRKKLREE